MKIINIKRNTKTEKRYSMKMGKLITKVTYVKKYFLGLPVKTLYKYRETYYGEVKDCDDCTLFI
jgi:negative regulator of genetic competence, sporulation and motility